MPVSLTDLAIITSQLGRTPRSILEVAYYTPDNIPAVITTFPRLSDNTPFPTLYYLTEPRIVAAVSALESTGIMRELTHWMHTQPHIYQQYQQAHISYLSDRNTLEDLGTNFSGGGMPDRVKCLHVLVAHSLAKGYGVNPIGDMCVAYLARDAILQKSVFPPQWPELTGEAHQLFSTFVT